MSNTRPTTELDFDNIKSDLIQYIKSNETFTDYNFEGSALNAIVDILAYNTHLNSYYANMLHSESFLDTAQKRASVVSRSKELGYTPRSATGSTAYVNVNALFSTESAQLNSITLSKGSQFSSVNDNGSFTFVADKDYISTKTSTSHYFNNVRLVEGNRIRNTFTIDTTRNVRSVFSIPNKGIDTSTLQIFVKDSAYTNDIVEYTKVDDIYNLKSDSRVYFIQESYNGFFEVYFGDNILGVQPVNGNIIIADYIYTENFDKPNLCKSFNFSGVLSSAAVSTQTTQQAYGGSVKEDITSIKSNAIKSNSAKERAVTSIDYEIKLMEKFSFIKSVSVWGGEDNVPPVYGKVFVSIQPTTGYTLTELVKRDVITPEIRKNSVITVAPVFVDPEYMYMDFKTTIKFNQNKTQNSRISVESSIKNIVSNYVSDISKFNTDYLESSLSSKILSHDVGIVSVDLDKRVGFKLEMQEGVETNFKRTANNSIIAGSISSSNFNVFYVNTVSVANIREVDLSNSLSTLGIYIGDTLVSRIGTVNMITGEFNITFSVYSYPSISRYINLRFDLVGDDIQVKRNQILLIDTDRTDTVSNILSNNLVVTELYDK